MIDITYTCDRCGTKCKNKYDAYRLDLRTIDSESLYSVLHVVGTRHLCTACKDDLLAFLKI